MLFILFTPCGSFEIQTTKFEIRDSKSNILFNQSNYEYKNHVHETWQHQIDLNKGHSYMLFLSNICYTCIIYCKMIT